MRILQTSLECYPLAKVGGLADVVGSLPKYLNRLNCITEVIMPLYNNDKMNNLSYQEVYSGSLQVGWSRFDFAIKKILSDEFGFQIYVVDQKELLYRPEVYRYGDDTERFVTFQLAVLDWVTQLQVKPDVIHCHDHHTGLIPFLMQQADRYSNLIDIPTVLTIHNAQYQGWFSFEKLDYLPPFNMHHIGLLDWDQQINPLAAGIKCATRVTTVSPNYMEELQRHANGLESLLSHENAKCVGILNGIDHDTWNPETDDMVIENYTIESVVSGRKANKDWLCEQFGLDPEKPLFAFIGRLVYEKGADLLPDIVSETINNQAVTMMMLGSGDYHTESRLQEIREQFIYSYNTYIGYDERLSHIIYAGADFLLMPSRVEPCGLNQMYALRYGLIPVVCSIGGLKDTVIDIAEKNGFGICHDYVTIPEVCHAIARGVELYNNQENYREIQQDIMNIDNSWDHSAAQYIKLYKSLK